MLAIPLTSDHRPGSVEANQHLRGGEITGLSQWDPVCRRDKVSSRGRPCLTDLLLEAAKVFFFVFFFNEYYNSEQLQSLFGAFVSTDWGRINCVACVKRLSLGLGSNLLFSSCAAQTNMPNFMVALPTELTYAPLHSAE